MNIIYFYYYFLYAEVHHFKACGPQELDEHIKKVIIWIGRNITRNPCLEQVTIIVIAEKKLTWDSLPQDSGSQEVAVRLELTSHRWNVDGIWMVCYNVRGIACASGE